MEKHYSIKRSIYFFIFILFSIFTQQINAQCAGLDNTVTICNKELNETLQTYILFDQLNGTPTTGGTWTADSPRNQDSLNPDGTLNLWTINEFGIHSFTYTNENCNETAVVTINLGGYPGEDNVEGGANACSNDPAVNLFAFLDNQLLTLNTDINGTWTGVGTANSYLDENFFNAEEAGPGTYDLIYTVAGVDTCNSEFAEVKLEVHRAPISGEGFNITICNSEDFSIYTDFDLFTLLIGEDEFGTWEDPDGLSQISNENDSTINIQEIYNIHGNGDYTFSYTVLPETHPICTPTMTEVTISISGILGRFIVDDFCGGNLDGINLRYDNSSRLTFEHDITYQIKNNNTNETIFSATSTVNIEPEENEEEGIDTDFFFLDTSIPILTAGNYTISTVSTSNVNGLTCSALVISETSFNVYNTNASIEGTCFEKDDILNIVINDYTNTLGELANEVKNLDYTATLNGTSQSFTNSEITFTNGNAIIPIDLSIFPNSSDGDFDLVFDNLNDDALECIRISKSIQFPPSEIQLSLSVDNECDATEILVTIDAPTLSNGQYTITYEVTEIGNPELLIDDTIIIVGGTAQLELDVSNLDTGDYEVVLRSIQNDMHPCRTKFEFILTESFSVGGGPETPELEPSQFFCFSDYLPNGPTINDILVNSDENLNWFTDETSTTPLPLSTLLIDGESYYVVAGDLNSVCNDSEKVVVVTSVNKIETPVIEDPNIVFCDNDNATIADINIETSAGGNLIWYDSLTGNTVLDQTTLLTNNTSYFVSEQNENCNSIGRLQINVILIPSLTPIFEGETALCALAEPTILTLEEQIDFNQELYDLVWSLEPQDLSSELSTSELLSTTTYYATLRHIEYGCEGEGIEISVTLDNCDPEEYAFFIPDGFSPNNDGTNDTFFIPNIKYFYPNYTYEIFNRYGQSLFKGDVNTPAWDGTNNGSQVETTSGIYFYVIDYNKEDLKPTQGRLYLSK